MTGTPLTLRVGPYPCGQAKRHGGTATTPIAATMTATSAARSVATLSRIVSPLELPS